MSRSCALGIAALLLFGTQAYAWAPSDNPHSRYDGEHYVAPFAPQESTYSRSAPRRYRHAHHVRHRAHARRIASTNRVSVLPAGSGIIRSRSGATAHVNPQYTASFQCLVNKLDQAGYKIEFMGGYGQRPNPHSLHPRGLALDIDQVSRNYLKNGKHFPSNVNEMASDCGLLHGDVHAWPRYPDYGHFQIKNSGFASDDDKALALGGEAITVADLDSGPKVCWYTPRFARTGPFKVASLGTITRTDAVVPEARDPDSVYLCHVYNRQPEKVDQTGDFTWKDKQAAERQHMTVCDYVIGGMAKALRTSLAAAGREMDKHFSWTILSGFRDDWRQAKAEGFKARTGNSLHGGSHATCGYGCGVAADIWPLHSDDFGPVARWMDKHARQFGLARPMPGRDPAHIQLANYEVAAGRTDRPRRYVTHHPRHHRHHRYASR